MIPGVVAGYELGATDPYWDNVIALVPFEDVRSPHDVAFYDLTGRGWFGRNQNMKRTNEFSPFGHGSARTSSDQYVYALDSADFDLGTGAFTMEALVRFNVVADCGFITQWSATSGNQAWAFWLFGGNLIWRISTAPGVYNDVQVAQAFTPGVDYYLAVDRTVAGLVRLYVNDIVVASATQAVNHLSCTKNPRIGSVDGFALDLDGHVSWVRITKGVARWGGTPPVRPPYLNGAPGVPPIRAPKSIMEEV